MRYDSKRNPFAILLNQNAKALVIRKHSATLHGHRTSFTLEEPFWQELKRIALSRNIPVARLIAEIDDTRGDGANLSSALRVYVLEWLKNEIGASGPAR